MARDDNHLVKLAFFGHHKCATNWIIRVINQLCQELALNYENFHSPKMFDFDLTRTVQSRNIDFFSYTNADINYVKELNDNFVGFHLIRDPRDIIVSAYYSHRYSHPNDFWPELDAHRKRLDCLDKVDGLFYIMEYLQSMIIDGDAIRLFDHMEMWDYSRTNIKEIKFEELILNPYFYMMETFNFLGVLSDGEDPLREKIIKRMFPFIRFGKQEITLGNALKIIYDLDFLKMTKGRGRGEEDKKHHFRKGMSGDWKNHFEEKHIEYFKDNYNGLLLKLGYESDDKWSI